jgi:RNA polymerase sigma factor (sigma-70 family)
LLITYRKKDFPLINHLRELFEKIFPVHIGFFLFFFLGVITLNFLRKRLRNNVGFTIFGLTDQTPLSLSLNNIGNSNSNLASKHEAEIWANLKAGDKNALSYFYTKYLKGLYNYGLKINRDSGLVEDCIQDVFIRVWNSRTRLADVSNVKSYFYKSLRGKIFYKLSILSRTPLKDIDSFSFELSHKSHYITQRINSDVSDKIKQFVNLLSPKQKEAIFLVYFEGLSYEEAAAIMDLKIKTVYNLIHLAIANLRQNKAKLSPSVFYSLF